MVALTFEPTGADYADEALRKIADAAKPMPAPAAVAFLKDRREQLGRAFADWAAKVDAGEEPPFKGNAFVFSIVLGVLDQWTADAARVESVDGRRGARRGGGGMRIAIIALAALGIGATGQLVAEAFEVDIESVSLGARLICFFTGAASGWFACAVAHRAVWQ